MTGVRMPGEVGMLSPHYHSQTDCGANPASYTMGTGVSSRMRGAISVTIHDVRYVPFFKIMHVHICITTCLTTFYRHTDISTLHEIFNQSINQEPPRHTERNMYNKYSTVRFSY
jgi:hypothetical protein